MRSESPRSPSPPLTASPPPLGFLPDPHPKPGPSFDEHSDSESEGKPSPEEPGESPDSEIDVVTVPPSLAPAVCPPEKEERPPAPRKCNHPELPQKAEACPSQKRKAHGAPPSSFSRKPPKKKPYKRLPPETAPTALSTELAKAYLRQTTALKRRGNNDTVEFSLDGFMTFLSTLELPNLDYFLLSLEQAQKNSPKLRDFLEGASTQKAFDQAFRGQGLEKNIWEVVQEQLNNISEGDPETLPLARHKEAYNDFNFILQTLYHAIRKIRERLSLGKKNPSPPSTSSIAPQAEDVSPEPKAHWTRFAKRNAEEEERRAKEPRRSARKRKPPQRLIES
jgi:hypothetical protein